MKKIILLTPLLLLMANPIFAKRTEAQEARAAFEEKFNNAITQKGSGSGSGLFSRFTKESDKEYINRLQAVATILFYMANDYRLPTGTRPAAPSQKNLADEIDTEKHLQLVDKLESELSYIEADEARNRPKKQLERLNEYYQRVLDKLPIEKRNLLGTTTELPTHL